MNEKSPKMRNVTMRTTFLHRLTWRKVVLVFTIHIFGDFSFITYGDQKKFNTILGIGGIVTIWKNYVQIESTGPLSQGLNKSFVFSIKKTYGMGVWPGPLTGL
jgi:hypothetical protein